MTHPRTRTGRSLIGLVLVLMGLSAYGCGDTGTQSQPAELGDLSASAGILEPKFNSATTAYTVKLFGTEASTTITVRPQVSGDRVQINNQERTSQTVTLASVGAFEDLTILVTDTGAGGTSKSYSVRVSREEEDTTLQALSSSDGTVAPSPFDKTEPEPSINGIGNGVTSITLTATKSDPNTVMVIKSPSGEVTVSAGTAKGEAIVPLGAPGSAITVPIVITGPKGGESTYKVTINRGASDNAFLGSLSISPVNLKDFKPSNTLYEVSVPSGTDKVTVTGKPQDANASMKILVNGVEDLQPPIQLLGPGQTTPITVHVTAQDGKSQQDYVIRVKQAALDGNNNLKSLSISPGKVDFKVNQLKYDVNVASGVGTVTVTATPEDSTAKITILRSGVTITSQPVTLLGPGDPTPITVRVTADNGKSQDYTINVIRAALNGNTDLKNLTVSPGSLSFNRADLDYNVNLLSDVTRVRITAAPEDSNASVTINGQPSPTDITIGAPGPEVRITVPIVVTAQNQKDKKTYNIFFIRAALGGNNNLQSLAVSQPGLSPSPFRADRTVYTLDVGSNVDNITVTATPQDTGASMSIKVNNGAPSTITAGQASPAISLAPGPSSTEIEVIVKAQNQSEKPYLITVTRAAPSSNANLSALSVTAGTAVTPLSSPFDSNTVTVAPEVGEVVVRATKDDATATMAIGSVTVPPGTASGQSTFTLNGAGGEPTPISVTVTAQNGVDVKTYTISVIRPAAPTPPAKPATAPDLLTADDSCPFDVLDEDGDTITNECFGSTSNEDNITTIKKPGFSVPTPGSGETAKLYMNGSEVPSSITENGATIILRPNADLPDGPYAVTYTLSNSVGESDKSPAMTPQLEINTIINN